MLKVKIKLIKALAKTQANDLHYTHLVWRYAIFSLSKLNK